MKSIRKKACVIMLSVSLASNCLYPAGTAWAAEEVTNDTDTVAGTFTEADKGNPLSVDVGKCYAFDVSGVADITGDVSWSMKSDGDYNGKDGENTLVDWKDSDEAATKRILQVKDYETPKFYQNEGIITITAATETGTIIAQWKISINKVITKATAMKLEKNNVTLAKNKSTGVRIEFTPETSGKTVSEEIKVSSDNENVATGSYDPVNQALNVKAVGAGMATITVTTVQSNLTASCTVNVSEYSQKDGITYYQNENYEGIVKKVETDKLFYQLPEAVDWTPLNVLETGAFSECTSTGMFQLPIGGQAGGIIRINSGAFPEDKSTFNVMLEASSPEVKTALEQMGINVVSKNSNIVLEKGNSTTVRLYAPAGIQTQWSISEGAENVSLSATEGPEVVLTGVTIGSAIVVGTVTRGEEEYSITYNITVNEVPTESIAPSKEPVGSVVPSNVPIESSDPSINIPTESSDPSINVPIESITPSSNIPTESSDPSINVPTENVTPSNVPVESIAPSETPIVPEEEFSTIVLSAKKVTIYAKGTKEKAKTVSIKGIEAADANKMTIVWKSENEKVAKVTKNDDLSAKITAVKKGTTKITATVIQGDRKKTYTVAVAVENPSIKITGKKIVKTSQKIMLKAVTYGLKEKVTWKVNNKKLATISSKGILKAKKKSGKVKVTATCGKYKATVTVTIK